MDFSQHVRSNDLWDLRRGKRLKVLDQHQCFVVGLPSTMKVTCCEANIYCILSLWVHGKTSDILLHLIFEHFEHATCSWSLYKIFWHILSLRGHPFFPIRCTLSCELVATFLGFFGTFQTCRLPDGGVGFHGGFGICLDHLRLRNGQTDKNEGENGKNIGETQKLLLTYRKF